MTIIGLRPGSAALGRRISGGAASTETVDMRTSHERRRIWLNGDDARDATAVGLGGELSVWLRRAGWSSGNRGEMRPLRPSPTTSSGHGAVIFGPASPACLELFP